MNAARRPFCLLAAASILLAVPLAQAQAPAEPAAKPIEFDAVSIKLNKSGDHMIRMMADKDGISATNIPLLSLVSTAYGIKEDLISGAPGWLSSDRYDVRAKVAGADIDAYQKLTGPQRSALFQAVFADRLKLKTHIETKELPLYELVVAKGGLKIHEAVAGDTYAKGIKGPDGTSRSGMMRMQPGQFEGQGLQITNLVDNLSRQVHRTVLDKTGLTGKYDFTLKWTPDPGAGGMPPGGGPPMGDAPAPDPSGPSLFTALEEQLGLRLQSAKGPVPTLVIDHVEQPSAD